MSPSVHIVLVTPERWPDLRRLFGANGACGGCWCMWWKLPRRDFVRGKGAGNERELRAIVRSGAAPGLLAYEGDRPVRSEERRVGKEGRCRWAACEQKEKERLERG